MNVLNYMEMIGCIGCNDGEPNWLTETCRSLTISQIELSRATNIPQPRLSRLWQVATARELNRKIKLSEAESIITYLHESFMAISYQTMGKYIM